MGEADAAEKASFRCYLDTGLARTSTGARIFGVLKGCADAGIDIPHSPKRFPGFADGKLNAEAHKDHIFGGHVGDYMEKLEEENEEAFKRQFSRFIKNGINSENIERCTRRPTPPSEPILPPRPRSRRLSTRSDGTAPRSATPSDEHVLPKSRLPSSEPKKQKSKYAPLFDYIVRVIRTGVKHLYMSSSVVKNTGLLL